MNQLIVFLLGIPAIMIATTIHEFTRAAVSSSLGDKLPREQGRLTINPLKHFEPIGMILMLACGFGWGLPVNTSALYYKDRKKGVLITAVAPTIANLIFAFVFAFAGMVYVKYIFSVNIVCKNSVLLLLPCYLQSYTCSAHGLPESAFFRSSGEQLL